MAEKIKKIQSDLLAVNAGVREVNERLNEILAGQSFAETSVAITGGQQISTISLAGTGLKGKIPSGAFFLLSYPDGSLPKAIENQGADLAAGTTSITVSQVVTADVPYPVGSLISSANYATNDSQFAAGNTTEVQYNGSGQLAANSNFTFETATETLEVTNATVSGTITGDVTGNVSGSSGSCTGNAATATKIASITNSNIVQLTDTQTLTNKTLTDCEANTQAVGDNSTKIATTAFVIANAGTGGGTPGGTGSTAFKSVQYNDNGSFGGDTSFQYNPASQILSVGNLFAANLSGSLAQNTVLNTSPPAGDDSKKVASTEWVLDNATTTIKIAQPTYTNAGAVGLGAEVVYFGTGTTAAGQIYYYSSSGWVAVDSDYSVGALGFLAVALGTSPTSNGMCIRGMVNVSGIEGSQQTGNVLYVSNTPGTSTTTNPSGQYDVVRVIGYALSSNSSVIYFNPSQDWVIHD